MSKMTGTTENLTTPEKPTNGFPSITQSEPRLSTRLAYSRSESATPSEPRLQRRGSILKRSNSENSLLKPNRVTFGENQIKELVEYDEATANDAPQDLPHLRRATPAYTEPSNEIDDRRLAVSAIKTTEVRQSISPHHFGPTSEVTVAIYRQTQTTPLGLSLCSPLDSEKVSQSLKGVRVSSIANESIVANSMQVGDRIISIDGKLVEDDSHNDVIEWLAKRFGQITFVLARPTNALMTNTSLLRRGVGSIKQKKKSSFSRKHRSIGTPVIDVSGAIVVTVHRHPNTSGFQFGVAGGFEGDVFPSVITATHPRSPFKPLTEGGELMNCYELLSIGDVATVGLRHSEVIELLKSAGEEVKIKALPPMLGRGAVHAPRHISDLFRNPSKNDATSSFVGIVRATLYKWIKPVTTRQCKHESEKSKYCFTSIDQFKKASKLGEFIEWVQHSNGDLYGIPKPVPEGADKSRRIFLPDHSSENIATSRGNASDASIMQRFLNRNLSKSMEELFDAVPQHSHSMLEPITSDTITSDTDESSQPSTPEPTTTPQFTQSTQEEVQPKETKTETETETEEHQQQPQQHDEEQLQQQQQQRHHHEEQQQPPPPPPDTSTSTSTNTEPHTQNNVSAITSPAMKAVKFEAERPDSGIIIHTSLDSPTPTTFDRLRDGLHHIQQLSAEGSEVMVQCESLLDVIDQAEGQRSNTDTGVVTRKEMGVHLIPESPTAKNMTRTTII